MNIHIDPTNPAHIFAACGLFGELARKAPDTTAHFEGDQSIVSATAEQVRDVIQILANSATIYDPRYEEPSNATPVILTDAGIYLDWYLPRSDMIVPPEQSSWKRRAPRHRLRCLWSGQQKPLNLLPTFQELSRDARVHERMFYDASMSENSSCTDYRSSWRIVETTGYSLNRHNEMWKIYPIVELLAFVGLQSFRPQNGTRGLVYGLWNKPVTVGVARMLLGAHIRRFTPRVYEFQIISRTGKFSMFQRAQPVIEENKS